MADFWERVQVDDNDMQLFVSVPDGRWCVSVLHRQGIERPLAAGLLVTQGVLHYILLILEAQLVRFSCLTNH